MTFLTLKNSQLQYCMNGNISVLSTKRRYGEWNGPTLLKDSKRVERKSE
jgi:hypothetical protein